MSNCVQMSRLQVLRVSRQLSLTANSQETFTASQQRLSKATNISLYNANANRMISTAQPYARSASQDTARCKYH